MRERLVLCRRFTDRTGSWKMPRLILPRPELKRLLRERRESGADRFDEVWNGVYVMSPLADNEHQDVATRFAGVLMAASGFRNDVRVMAGVNISDQTENWKQNYRCPDVAVFLPGNPAVDQGSHWLGGPDFAIEVVSRRDRSRKKFDFYQSVGVRELLLIDRWPWSVELHRMEVGHWSLVGRSDPNQGDTLPSSVLPLTFQMLPGTPRPRIVVACNDGTGHWLV